MLHAIKIKRKPANLDTKKDDALVEENEEQGSKPLCGTLKDAMFSNDESTTEEPSTSKF